MVIPNSSRKKECAESSKNIKAEYRRCIRWSNKVETYPEAEKTELNSEGVVQAVKWSSQLSTEEGAAQAKRGRAQGEWLKELDN